MIDEHLELTITTPSDFHLHFREGDFLPVTVPHIAKDFHYAVAMPNLVRPVVSVEQALSYRKQLVANNSVDNSFYPLMALYLQETTLVTVVQEVAETPEVLGFKLYPQGATTQSTHGVSKIENIYPLLEAMEEQQVPLLIHGESLVDPDGKDVDVFDREKVFIETTLLPIIKRFPNLILTLEHITTKDAVAFIMEASNGVKGVEGSQKSGRIGATVTSHHLYLNRNHLLADGIRPHYYCKPIVKRLEHQEALVKAVTSGDSRFFMGSDSAPHLKYDKESSCGCAGLYTAPQNVAWYAEAFYQENALQHFENFMSFNGCLHYGLEPPTTKLKLERINDKKVPLEYTLGDRGGIVPFKAGEVPHWSCSR